MKKNKITHYKKEKRKKRERVIHRINIHSPNAASSMVLVFPITIVSIKLIRGEHIHIPIAGPQKITICFIWLHKLGKSNLVSTCKLAISARVWISSGFVFWSSAEHFLTRVLGVRDEVPMRTILGMEAAGGSNDWRRHDWNWNGNLVLARWWLLIVYRSGDWGKMDRKSIGSGLVGAKPPKNC